MISPKNLVRHELIGLEVRITDSSNKKQIGLSGKVVDESRNLLTVETDKGEKKFAKEHCTFSFKVDSEWIKIEGKLLLARPEDRVKKKFKKW
ncbi:MAG: ribonuclease P protein component 1 [Candidatus Aenigmatarchaeota archaeon]